MDSDGKWYSHALVINAEQKPGAFIQYAGESLWCVFDRNEKPCRFRDQTKTGHKL